MMTPRDDDDDEEQGWWKVSDGAGPLGIAPATSHSHTLHTIGMFSCCQTSACWKSRIVPAGDASNKDQNLCQWPVLGLARPVARCMAAIRPDEVITLLERILVCQQNAQ